MKISFESDYNNGCHEAVLQRLIETNGAQTTGYGLDEYCKSAAMKIRQACELPNAQVFFLVGGTQTNATVIDALLASHEGVLAVDSGHIAVHESGAIEACGHKVLTMPANNGKMLPSDLKRWLHDFYADATWQHMVIPGMVYLTFPTEWGTIYTRQELYEIASICRENGLLLYIDGARLPYGLMSPVCDLTLQQLSSCCDAFYFGGTKCGALCGEAVVFTRSNTTPRHFFTTTKRHGALLAKGRMLGIQFDALFTNNLYWSLAKNAVELALRLRDAFIAAGYTMAVESFTNQQFVILPNTTVERLSNRFVFEQWQPIDKDTTLCRFVTSWATTIDEIKALETNL